MTTVEHGVVAELGQAIAHRIGEPRFKFWFDTNTKFQWDDDVLTVGVSQSVFSGMAGEQVRRGCPHGRQRSARSADARAVRDRCRPVPRRGAARPTARKCPCRSRSPKRRRPPNARAQRRRGDRRCVSGTGGGSATSSSGRATGSRTPPPSAWSRRRARGPTRSSFTGPSASAKRTCSKESTGPRARPTPRRVSAMLRPRSSPTALYRQCDWANWAASASTTATAICSSSMT